MLSYLEESKFVLLYFMQHTNVYFFNESLATSVVPTSFKKSIIQNIQRKNTSACKQKHFILASCILILKT